MSKIALERDGAVAIVRFVNPPHGYMDLGMVKELDEVTAALAADAAVRAVVFTGEVPGVFIQHYDVGELDALARKLRADGRRFTAERPVPPRDIDRVLERLETMDKPAIAAINGNAMGGGFEFCLACDLRIAERGPFSLGLPEINIGILPGAGGTQRLARLIGPARALELVLRGRTVTADEAAALGMVHEASDGPVLQRALVVARELANKSPLAIRHIKRLIRQAAQQPLAEGLALERTLFLDLMTSDAAAALIAQFVDGSRDIRTR